MSRPLRVLVAGADRQHAVGQSLYRGFLALGYDAHFFDEGWAGSGWRLWQRALQRALRPVAHPVLNFALLARALAVRPDLLVIVKGNGYLPETIAALKRAARAVVVYHTDDLKNPLNTNGNILAALPLWDAVFCPRRFALDEICAAGARRAEFLPFGYDPELSHLVEVRPDDPLRGTVAFVGTWAPERVPLLEACAGRFRVRVWGNGWERVPRSSALCAAVAGQPAYGEDACRVLSGAAIDIALLRKQNRDRHTMRTFEIPACAGFMLAERTDEHRELFEEGREAVFFEGAEELLAQIQRYLPDEAGRRAIADAGHRRLLAGRHRYRDRAERIAEVAREIMR